MGIDLNRFRKNRPSEWIEWLSDDPLPPKPQQLVSVQPQVHRPQTYSPVRGPATPIPVQHSGAVNNRPAAPPGIAQPIQLAAPTMMGPQPARPTQILRPAQPATPSQPVAMTRQVRPIQPLMSSDVVKSPSPQVVHRAPDAPSAAVSIQISMPKLPVPKLPALPYKRIGHWVGGIAAASGFVFGGWTAYRHFRPSEQVAVKGASTVHAAPTFDTLAPQDKPQLGEGTDPANTAYDGKRNLYTFKDTLMGFPLVVSQQPLPDDAKKDPSKLKKIAESMGGTVTSTDTAYGMVYISTTEKGDAQRSVFAHKDVMVFVQSYRVFDSDTWKYYVETLRQ